MEPSPYGFKNMFMRTGEGLGEYKGITRSPLPPNNGNSPLPFFGDNHRIVLLDNIYLRLHMYIN